MYLAEVNPVALKPQSKISFIIASASARSPQTPESTLSEGIQLHGKIMKSVAGTRLGVAFETFCAKTVVAKKFSKITKNTIGKIRFNNMFVSLLLEKMATQTNPT
jgi:hypothetical protein